MIIYFKISLNTRKITLWMKPIVEYTTTAAITVSTNNTSTLKATAATTTATKISTPILYASHLTMSLEESRIEDASIVSSHYIALTEGVYMTALQEVTQTLQTVQHKYQHLLTYFGEKATLSWNEFMSSLSTFVIEFQQVSNQVERAQQQEHRKQLRLAAAQQLKENQAQKKQQQQQHQST